MRLSLALFLGVLLSLCMQAAPAPSCGMKCGSERWIVKAFADRDAGRARCRSMAARTATST